MFFTFRMSFSNISSKLFSNHKIQLISSIVSFKIAFQSITFLLQDMGWRRGATFLRPMGTKNVNPALVLLQNYYVDNVILQCKFT